MADQALREPRVRRPIADPVALLTAFEMLLRDVVDEPRWMVISTDLTLAEIELLTLALRAQREAARG